MKATAIVFTVLLGMVLLQDVTDADFPPLEKLGKCPLPPSPRDCMVMKKNTCNYDYECLGDDKCCDNCGKECTVIPIPLPAEKPGKCPLQKSCKNDLSCPGKKKCCYQCGSTCLDPIL